MNLFSRHRIYETVSFFPKGIFLDVISLSS